MRIDRWPDYPRGNLSRQYYFSPNAELIDLLSCLLSMSALTESEDDSSYNAFEISQISRYKPSLLGIFQRR